MVARYTGLFGLGKPNIHAERRLTSSGREALPVARLPSRRHATKTAAPTPAGGGDESRSSYVTYSKNRRPGARLLHPFTSSHPNRPLRLLIFLSLLGFLLRRRLEFLLRRRLGFCSNFTSAHISLALARVCALADILSRSWLPNNSVETYPSRGFVKKSKFGDNPSRGLPRGDPGVFPMEHDIFRGEPSQ